MYCGGGDRDVGGLVGLGWMNADSYGGGGCVYGVWVCV